MTPKIFTSLEREEMRIKMLDAGFSLIKEYGMTHTSVDKIMEAVGLKKSTFYNFFHSKEMFVYEIILLQREKFWKHFDTVLSGREKVSVSEGKELLRTLFCNPNSIYQHLTQEDENKLQAALPKEYFIDDNKEKNAANALLGRIEGIQSDIDYKLIANLMKILAMVQEGKDVLHEDALDRTLDALFDLMFSFIFNESR
ncbi:TetR family transcriptional regulator [Alkalibaculum sp. M08DMB]|uniref:TetR family transcriptional regulator n=1 Tax=Alkalibaculum sporogenes TaxID=2655001 RepID=A0A6A7K7V5_9FIRM|nr:TetR/AcrR family transcriptional regulator [Alkalibaculum sporogenes]MPW25494.1 TetR family transcriptional regulator [Alkalibaculum sporogenes]